MANAFQIYVSAAAGIKSAAGSDDGMKIPTVQKTVQGRNRITTVSTVGHYIFEVPLGCARQKSIMACGRTNG